MPEALIPFGMADLAGDVLMVLLAVALFVLMLLTVELLERV